MAFSVRVEKVGDREGKLQSRAAGDGGDGKAGKEEPNTSFTSWSRQHSEVDDNLTRGQSGAGDCIFLPRSDRKL